MKSVDLAYAAGIIDGEGSIKIFRVSAEKLNRNFDRFQLQVQVDMVKTNAVYWLQKIFGGNIYEHKRKNHLNWNDSKRWYIVSQRAGIFLKQILPYLKVKKQHAELAIYFLTLPPKDIKKIKCWEQNRILNKVGKL